MTYAAKIRREFWRRRARGGSGLEGYATAGSTAKATLYIGRKAGLSYGGWREGEKIPISGIVTSIVGRRAEQIGPAATGLTYVTASGVYRGQREQSARVELQWEKSKREPSVAAFSRNVKKLAQHVAGDLAQREVIVEWNTSRKRGHTDIATPTKAPSKRDKRFCAWVRRFSHSARTRPRDPCWEG